MAGIFASENTPTYTYTVGISPKFGFELIIMGPRYQIAGYILNEIVTRHLAAGKKLEMNVPQDWVGNMPAIFRECDPKKVRELGNQAFEYYGKEDIKFIQIVIPDREGRFPEDAGYDYVQQALYTI